RMYEDLGLLTVDPIVGADVADLFNHLSGYTKHRDYRTLLVAPDTLRTGLMRLIAEETEHAAAGRPSGITLKLNSLVDEQVIDALYDASIAGVPVDIIVRGMCALRPGAKGLSETIKVRSILGRFLEHSRVFRFAAGGDERYFIGSADVMHRNLDRRVEALAEIRDGNVRDALGRLLAFAMDPATSAWVLGSDGLWNREVTGPDGSPLRDYQQVLLRAAAKRAGESAAGPHA
ncbi:MAG TPA: RNA degradosome polyphosphate kinase, partial [Mycobacteriales bacterium]|nr:RNA degradosome polyphosphate kinase [Mycobacteriales bacterium]